MDTMFKTPACDHVLKNSLTIGAFCDRSGNSVAISADWNIVAIGAWLNNGINGKDSGHERVFRNVDDDWVQFGSNIDGEAAGDNSGISVSISADGDVVANGAYINNGNGGGSGHVRVKLLEIGLDIQFQFLLMAA